MNAYLGMKVANAEIQLKLRRAENRRIATILQRQKHLETGRVIKARMAQALRSIAEKLEATRLHPSPDSSVRSS